MSNTAPKDEFEMPTIQAVKNESNEQPSRDEVDIQETENSNVEIESSHSQVSDEQLTSNELEISEQIEQSDANENVGEDEDEDEPKSNKKILIAILSFVLLSGTGVGIYGYKNGYLSSMPKIQGMPAEITQQEAVYNQKFAEIAIKLNDHQTSFESTASKNEILVLRQDMERMNNDYKNQTELRLNNLKSELKADHANSLSGIQTQVEKIKNQMSDLSSKDSVTKKDIGRLQSDLERQINALKVDKVETQKSKMNDEIKSSEKKSLQPKANPNEPTKTASYAGLIMNDSFLWANQYIATLSDSRGTDFQVARGDMFGHYQVTKVTSNEVHIKNQTTSRQVIIFKE